MEKMPYIKIPLHGQYGKGRYALVDADYDGEYFSQFKWYVTPKGYVVRQDGHGQYGRKLVLLHHEVLRTDKAKAGYIVRDHIDQNPLNNRSCNLRLVTQAQNLANKRRKRGRLVGVHKSKKSKGYYVMVGRKYIGSYATTEDAILAREEAALRIYGH